MMAKKHLNPKQKKRVAARIKYGIGVADAAGREAKRQAKARKLDSGLGATEPIRGLEAQKAIESLIGMPLTSGCGKCLLSLGVDAADALLTLLCKLGVQKSDLPIANRQSEIANGKDRA
jgi:hypothetical protein